MESFDFRVFHDGSVANFGEVAVDESLRDLALGLLAENLSRAEFIWTQDAVPVAVCIERIWHSGHPAARVQGVRRTRLPLGTTARELDVVTLLIAGLTNTQIAEALNLSVRTVTTHVDRLMRKYDAPNRGTVATIALDQGLIALPLPAAAGTLERLNVGRMLRSAGATRRSSSVPSHHTQNTIRIGALIPSMGRGEADALEMLNGATKAIEEINARGGIHGRMLAMEVVDVDADDVSSTRAVLPQLLRTRPAALTSGYLAGQSVVMDTTAAEGIPFLHSSASSLLGRMVAGNAQRYRNTFQFSPNDDDYAPAFVAFLNDLRTSGRWQPATNRIAIVAQSRWEFVDLGLVTARLDAEASGWELITITASDRQNRAWADAAHAVKRSDVSAVMIGSYFPSDHIQLIREYLRAPGEALIYSAYAPSVSDFRTGMGQACEGLIWATTTGTYPDELGMSFTQRYSARFGRPPGRSHAGVAYDRIHILAHAWRQVTDVREFDEVGRRLAETRYRGVNGAYVFDAAEHRTLSLGRTSSDPSLSQAHTVFQVQSGRNALIAPAPYAEAVFTPPPWTTAGGRRPRGRR